MDVGCCSCEVNVTNGFPYGWTRVPRSCSTLRAGNCHGHAQLLTVCCARVRHPARAYVQFTVDFVVLAGVREDRIEVRCTTIALVPV